MQRYAFFLKYLLRKVIANNFILYVKLVDVVSLKKQYVFVVETGWLIVHKKRLATGSCACSQSSIFEVMMKTLFNLNVLHNLCFLLWCSLRNHDGKNSVGNAC